MDGDEVARLLADQEQVVSRRQVVAAGGGDGDIERLLRRREWARVHEGVYVAHTGPRTWPQRAWAAVLVHAPAALSGPSALRAWGLTAPGTEAAPIDVVVAHHRRVHDPPGVRTSRSSAFEAHTLLHLGPPRVRVEHAVLTTAAQAGREDAAVAVLADACQQRLTTPARLAGILAELVRLPRRRLLAEVLDDVAGGAYSALERRYLRDVERPHGLPTGHRQRRDGLGARPTYRDVEYVGLATVVELDGRLGHDRIRDRWHDLERDLASAASGSVTLRAGWAQVLQPCRLAATVGAVLRSRGWSGTPTACGPGCPVRK
ncbi:hypothetical protein [Nocardioides dongkuii]|uniref:hypothetical protein n=1 Tax=Nocardioides dongkuii TaxID=2760089 RepID=UPI001D0CD337|nr:hypothetical protein [Nocardioides dongkuii]